MGCLFCNIVEKKAPADVVLETEHAIVFRDIRPVAPTHVLVVPKRHVAAVHDLRPEDAPLMGHVLDAARTAADKLGISASGFRLVVNDGEHGAQTVHHLHVHVLGGRQMSWPPG